MIKQRIPWFDNVKGLLIFLVVFGHFIESYRNPEHPGIILYFYNVIYFFHMPLFIMVSGYFFRPQKFERIIQLISVYLVWQIANGFLQKLIQDHTLVNLSPDGRILDIFDPYWTLWYLLGIVVWSIVTPYFLRLRYPIIISLIFAVAISYVDHVPTWFSMRKLVNFYPFFLIGYSFTKKNVLISLSQKTKICKIPIRWVALSIVAVFLVFMIFFNQLPSGTEFLFLRSSYSYFTWSILKGAVIHLAYYGVVVVLSISLMLLVPKEKKLIFFNKLGVNSLFIYLIHTNIVRVYREIAPEQLVSHKGFVILGAILFASIVCWLLTRKFTLNLFKPVILPRLNWMIKQKEVHS
ncbi:acyltransferase family protein [Bacillus salipaludis]|uniref:acyltransferase family protein n=1 Tax=Bacillus salipaludis TaxID=2547811 RepID=UPI003D1CDF79